MRLCLQKSGIYEDTLPAFETMECNASASLPDEENDGVTHTSEYAYQSSAAGSDDEGDHNDRDTLASLGNGCE